MPVRTISFRGSAWSLHPVTHRSGRSLGNAVTHVYGAFVACATKYLMPSSAARSRVVCSVRIISGTRAGRTSALLASRSSALIRGGVDVHPANDSAAAIVVMTTDMRPGRFIASAPYKLDPSTLPERNCLAAFQTFDTGQGRAAAAERHQRCHLALRKCCHLSLCDSQCRYQRQRLLFGREKLHDERSFTGRGSALPTDISAIGANRSLLGLAGVVVDQPFDCDDCGGK